MPEKIDFLIIKLHSLIFELLSINKTKSDHINPSDNSTFASDILADNN